jgi:large subunit ribosomal protein L20
MKEASGFRGKRSSCHAIAMETLQHAWMHMYRNRKKRKRDFRRLWIVRINAACRQLDEAQSYSRFIGALKSGDIELNRKMLAEIAITDPVAFKAIVSTAAAA